MARNECQGMARARLGREVRNSTAGNGGAERDSLACGVE